MASLNFKNCVSGASNTGAGSCSLDIKNVVGMIIAPRSYTITQSQLATLQTKLEADALNDNKASRIYPVSPFVDFKDESEKRVTEKLGYGAQVTVRDGMIIWNFRFNQGGFQLLQALRKFNGSNWGFFFIDSNNVLFGTSDGAGGIKAIPVIEQYTEPYTINDGKKTTEYWTSVCFNPSYTIDNAAWIADAGFDIIDTVEGIVNVTLSSVTNATSGNYTIVPVDSSGTPLGAMYATQLAAMALWSATNVQTGANIPITAVTYDAVSGGFIVALNKTAPAYPTGTTDKISINLVGPTELAAANVSAYESTGAISIVHN